MATQHKVTTKHDHTKRVAHSPIDMVHLSRQTCGDAALETEVLQLFLAQCRKSRIELANCETKSAFQVLAHQITGTAANMGAGSLADAARELEHAPKDTSFQLNVTLQLARIEEYLSEDLHVA